MKANYWQEYILSEDRRVQIWIPKKSAVSFHALKQEVELWLSSIPLFIGTRPSCF